MAPWWERAVNAGLVNVHDEEREAGTSGLTGLARELSAEEVQECGGGDTEGDREQERAWGGVGVAHAVGFHALYTF